MERREAKARIVEVVKTFMKVADDSVIYSTFQRNYHKNHQNEQDEDRQQRLIAIGKACRRVAYRLSDLGELSEVELSQGLYAFKLSLWQNTNIGRLTNVNYDTVTRAGLYEDIAVVRFELRRETTVDQHFHITIDGIVERMASEIPKIARTKV